MQVQVLLCAPYFCWESEVGVDFQESFLSLKLSGGFPKVLEEGGVTAKIYKSFIKDKHDLFTLAYYRREEAGHCPAGLLGGLHQLLKQAGLAGPAPAGKQEQV